ncbi:MAG: HU family DNA-binding protein [Pseudomonadota bacterium]
MSKLEFIANVADAAGCSNADAKRMVEIVFGQIEEGLSEARENGKYTISSFGTFVVSERAARKGRHPQTGEEIDIAASKSLRFRPAASLKSAAGC